jgi:hypothetical protein
VAYRLQKVEGLMAGLQAADAFLVKRAFIDGASVETLAELWGVPGGRDAGKSLPLGILNPPAHRSHHPSSSVRGGRGKLVESSHSVL